MLSNFRYVTQGAVHKVRHCPGEGVDEGVTVCYKGWGQHCVTSHFLNFSVVHMKSEIESDV